MRVFLSLAVIFAAHLTHFGTGANSMARNICALALSMSAHDTITIDQYVARTYGNPEGFGDVATFGGHYYSGEGPGCSFLLTPIAWVAHHIAAVVFPRTHLANHAEASSPGHSQVLPTQENLEILFTQLLGTIFLVIPLSALAWTCLYKLLVTRFSLSVKTSLIAVFAGALGTDMFFYSSYIASAWQTASALAVLAFYCVTAPTTTAAGRAWRFALAGFCLGAAVATEYPVALVAICLTVYVFASSRWRDWLPFVAAGLLWVILLGAFQHAAFGNPLSNPHQYQRIPVTFGGVGGEPYYKSFSLERIYGMTFSPYKGIFVYNPWLIFGAAAFFSPVLWRRHRKELLFFAGTTLGFVLFFSGHPYWFGGHWGMPYLLPTLPLLTICFALIFERYGQRRPFRVCAYAGLAVGVLINYLPFGVNVVASQRDPPWSRPILLVLRTIRTDGFCLYLVDFASRNVHSLSTGQKALMHVIIYGVLLAALILIWRTAFETQLKVAQHTDHRS